MTVDTFLPADAQASLGSAGVSFAVDTKAGCLHFARQGTRVGTIERTPPRFVWTDPAFGTLVATLMDYNRLTRQLNASQGKDPYLRDQLGIDKVLRLAEMARVRVAQRGGLGAKEFTLWHPAFNDFVALRVPRGHAFVIEMAFADPQTFIPLHFMASYNEHLARALREPSVTVGPLVDLERRSNEMDGTPIPSVAKILSELTEDQAQRLKVCGVDGLAITGEYIVVTDEMGLTPAAAICRVHLEAMPPEQFESVTENALYGAGHACVPAAGTEADDMPECWLCHYELGEVASMARVRLAEGTVREYPATPEGGMQMLRDTFEQARHR